MIATCSHLDLIADVPDGAEVCETCMAEGGTWVSLRQCLVCGRTNCCNSSPNQHATGHYHETGHQLMRTLEPGQDWSWCYACEQSMRQADDGTWQATDPFYEAGLWFAERHARETSALNVEPEDRTPEGFELGVWIDTMRSRRRAGDLDDDQAAAIEALPGWRW